MTKQHFYAESREHIYKQMDVIISEKVYNDIESAKDQIDNRLPDPFPNAIYDQMLLQYGIYTVSIKKLMQMVNGLQLIEPHESYGHSL